jgi:hypothetical protein
VTSWMAVFRLLGTLALVASAARAFVAFAAWRKSFVNRLIGADQNPTRAELTRSSFCANFTKGAASKDRNRICAAPGRVISFLTLRSQQLGR